MTNKKLLIILLLLFLTFIVLITFLIYKYHKLERFDSSNKDEILNYLTTLNNYLIKNNISETKIALDVLKNDYISIMDGEKNMLEIISSLQTKPDDITPNIPEKYKLILGISAYWTLDDIKNNNKYILDTFKDNYIYALSRIVQELKYRGVKL